MLSFVQQHGDVPPGAHRIADHDAAMHTATWVRRNVGLGTACAYVIGFSLGDKWWTFFFDRMEAIASASAEIWKIGSYSNEASSWESTFWYFPETARWHGALVDPSGEDDPNPVTA